MEFLDDTAAETCLEAVDIQHLFVAAHVPAAKIDELDAVVAEIQNVLPAQICIGQPRRFSFFLRQRRIITGAPDEQTCTMGDATPNVPGKRHSGGTPEQGQGDTASRSQRTYTPRIKVCELPRTCE